MTSNGKLPLDPGILTPNDLKRVKVAVGGQSPQELMGEVATLWQVLLFAVRSRTDPSFTWEQAGETPLGEVFDMAGTDEPPPPQGGPPGSPGQENGTSAAATSTTKRGSSAPARSSASTSA